MTEVIEQMGIPEHIDDFKVHYRMRRDTFYIVLENIQDKIFLVVIKHFQYTFRIKAAILTRLDWYRTVFNQSFNRPCSCVEIHFTLY
jgi:hypothetical protein